MAEAKDSNAENTGDRRSSVMAKALPEHMRKMSNATGKKVSVNQLGGCVESKPSVNLHDKRRSSIFSTEDMAVIRRLSRDRGHSIASLNDSPSTHVHGINKGVPPPPKKVISYENTYIMDPSGVINCPGIRDMINSVLEDKFQDTQYNQYMSGQICKRTSDAILEGMKNFEIERYKIVCTTTISQNNGQGIRQASRFLWNDKHDMYIDGYFQNSYLIAQGTVYLLYYE